jgi:hypothetical protein
MNRIPHAWLIFRFCLVGAIFAGDVLGDALDNWQWRIAVPQGNDLTGITYGNGVYVTIGNHATLLSSTNGSDWQVHSLELPKRLAAVTFGNGRFVAVGDNLRELESRDYILVSTNGSDWTDVSTGSNQVLTVVAFGNGNFLASGYDTPSTSQTRLMTSTDGTHWIDQSAIMPPYLDSITWGNGLFVGVDGLNVFSSTNGLSWHSEVAPFRGLEAVRFLNGRFVAVGHDDDYQNTGIDRPSFAVSTNGLNWTGGGVSDYSPYNSHQGIEVNDVGFANGCYVAIGSYSSGVPAVWVSTNAEDWNLLPIPEFTAVPTRVLGESDRIIAVGNSGLVAVSANGTNWNQIIGPAEEKSLAITYGNGLFVGVGAAGAVQTSRDGVNWSHLHAGPPDRFWLDVAYGNNRFVAVSRAARVMSSPDGTNWMIQPSGDFGLAAVTYGAGKFVAVGGDIFNSYGILTSTDGSNWTTVATGGGFDLWGVTYGQGLFMAVGSSGHVLMSSNAVQWTGASAPSDAYFRSVAFGNGIFVASGARNSSSLVSPSLYYSTNGLNWTVASVPSDAPYFTLDRVMFANGLFITVSDRVGSSGGGMIFTSVDGVHWQARHSPTMQDLTGAAANESSFVLVGPLGTILQSGDLRPRLRFERCCSDDAGVFELMLSGVSNCLYQTEFSTDLIHWTARWTNQVTLPEVSVFQTGAAFPHRFYRAQLVPQ